MQEMVLIHENYHKFKMLTMVFLHLYSGNEFIVDDDDEEEDQEEDVFFDPGFTPELEEISDDDKENEDIATATPGTLSGVWNPNREWSSNGSSHVAYRDVLKTTPLLLHFKLSPHKMYPFFQPQLITLLWISRLLDQVRLMWDKKKIVLHTTIVKQKEIVSCPADQQYKDVIQV